MRLLSYVLAAAVATADLAAPCRAADKASAPSPATVSFSGDERTVIIDYGGKERSLTRPVVSPWEYKAAGTTYWASPDGDDANPGWSTERPFLTIRKAIAAARAGDVIYLKAGTYVEDVRITKSGEENKPLILSCAPGDLGKVVVTSSKEYVEKNPHGAVVTLQKAEYVWINGLVIEGPKGRPEAPAKETYGANGITWANKAGKGCRATNNVVYNNVHCGMKEMGHGGTEILIEGNVIFGNGTGGLDHGIYMPSNDMTLNGNVIFENAGWGIHAYSTPKRLVITRNVCFGNKSGGIVLGGSGCKVFNNVCADNGIGFFYFRGGCTGNAVENNIFCFNHTDCGYDNGGGQPQYGSPSDNTDDFNCYFPGKPHPAIKPGPNELTTDPRFVDAKKNDYRLRDDSPCRAAGTDVGLPFDGKKPNLGAY